MDAAKEDVCSMEASEDYNLGLHIGSVFILLGVSAGGALLPVVLHISSKSGSVMAVIKMGTFFGELGPAAVAARHLDAPCECRRVSCCHRLSTQLHLCALCRLWHHSVHGIHVSKHAGWLLVVCPCLALAPASPSLALPQRHPALPHPHADTCCSLRPRTSPPLACPSRGTMHTRPGPTSLSPSPSSSCS